MGLKEWLIVRTVVGHHSLPQSINNMIKHKIIYVKKKKLSYEYCIWYMWAAIQASSSRLEHIMCNVSRGVFWAFFSCVTVTRVLRCGVTEFGRFRQQPHYQSIWYGACYGNKLFTKNVISVCVDDYLENSGSLSKNGPLMQITTCTLSMMRRPLIAYLAIFFSCWNRCCVICCLFYRMVTMTTTTKDGSTGSMFHFSWGICFFVFFTGYKTHEVTKACGQPCNWWRHCGRCGDRCGRPTVEKGKGNRKIAQLQHEKKRRKRVKDDEN